MADAKNLNVNINRKKVVKHSSGASGFYFLGFIGALIYFVGAVDGFWPIILAFFKACVWPAFLVYELLKFLYS